MTYNRRMSPKSPSSPRELGSEGEYRRRVRAALDHAQRNLHRPLALAELAETAGFSPFHFHRIFAGMTGETVGACVRRLRLESAAGHLEFTSKSVTRIAAESCYDSLEAFSRAFKAHFGLTPSQYRYQAPKTRRQRMAELSLPAAKSRRACALQVRVVTRPAVRVACARSEGPYMESAYAAWKTLCAWAEPRGLLTPQALCMGMCYDDPGLTAPEKLRYDACLSVDPAVTAEGDVTIMTIDGGEFAMATHKGAHERLEQAYVELYGVWLPASGRLPSSRPCFEIYRNFPDATPAEELLTEMYAPLEPQYPME